MGMGSSSVTGTVSGTDNKPIKDARVEIRSTDTNALVSATYTNTSGSFEFLQVVPGSYHIVAYSGLDQAEDRLEVGSMHTIITLRMFSNAPPVEGSSNARISVAEYQIPQKARDELDKAKDALHDKKTEEAHKHLTKALEISPTYSDALTMSGIMKMDAGDVSGATADVQKAIDSDSRFPFAYIVMGAILNTQGKFDQAVRLLDRAQSLAPDSWQAYFEMSKALVGKGEFAAALRQLDRVEQLVPEPYPPVHLVKAHALLALSQYADAMNELQAYLDKEPQGPDRKQAEKMMDQARAFLGKQ